MLGLCRSVSIARFVHHHYERRAIDAGERKEFLSRQNLCSPIAVTGARERRRRSGSRAIFPHRRRKRAFGPYRSPSSWRERFAAGSCSVRRANVSWFSDARRKADPSQHRASLGIAAGTQPRRFAAREPALVASLVWFGFDHGGSAGDRGSECARTLKSGGYAQGLFALVQERRNRLCRPVSERPCRVQKSWTLLGHFGWLLRRQTPRKYLILLSGEVAEWSKAPDC